MDKRNAVILTGFARRYRFCFSDFLENLITSDNVDVFIATWNYVGVKAKYVSEQTITLSNNKTKNVKLKVSADDSQIDIDDIREKYNPTDIKVFDTVLSISLKSIPVSTRALIGSVTASISLPIRLHLFIFI